MPEDNQIRDAFHNSSLDNEDWLQPSDIVFDNIESEIYGKKKRRWFVYWWIPVLSFLLLGALTTYMYWPNANNNKPSTITNNSSQLKSSTTKNNHAGQASNAKEANSIATNKDKSVDLADQKETDKNTSNNKTIATNHSTLSDTQMSSAPSLNKNQTNNSNEPKISASSLSSKQSAPTINSNSYNKSTQNSSQKEFNEPLVQSEATTIVNNNSTLNTSSSKANINQSSINQVNATNSDKVVPRLRVIELPLWDKMNVIELPIWDKNNQGQELDLATSPTNTIDLPTISPWALSIHTAASFWNFKLNQDYRDALQAADFSHNVGKGFLFALGIERKMTKVISLKTQFSFERITFESGHNSGINYDPNTEGENNANDFDLTMASPIGFLKSNISVERTNDEITEATDLIVDLNNSHQITNFDWGLSGLAHLINRANFSTAIELGGGVQYLGNIKNELYQFSTSAGFNSKSAKITEDQNELNKIRPYAFGGINLGYQFGLKNTLQLQYQYKQDLQNIYEGGDFSTRLNRQQIGLVYKRFF